MGLKGGRARGTTRASRQLPLQNQCCLAAAAVVMTPRSHATHRGLPFSACFLVQHSIAMTPKSKVIVQFSTVNVCPCVCGPPRTLPVVCASGISPSFLTCPPTELPQAGTATAARTEMAQRLPDLFAMEHVTQPLQDLGIVDARDPEVSCKNCLKGHKCPHTGKPNHTPSPAKVRPRLRLPLRYARR